MATKFTPLYDRILIRRIPESDVSRGGIIIPDSAKEKPQEGEVVSVGAGRVNDEGKILPLTVKVGDRVYFGKYAGSETRFYFESEGQDFVVMKEDEVLGIITGVSSPAKKETVGSKR